MADRATLAALLDRVRGKTEPDTMLFFDLREQLLPNADYVFKEDYHAFLYALAWTDAALALAERALPGCLWQVCRDLDGPGACVAHDTVMYWEHRRATPALALLAATLAALLAQAEPAAADAL